MSCVYTIYHFVLQKKHKANIYNTGMPTRRVESNKTIIQTDTFDCGAVCVCVCETKYKTNKMGGSNKKVFKKKASSSRPGATGTLNWNNNNKEGGGAILTHTHTHTDKFLPKSIVRQWQKGGRTKKNNNKNQKQTTKTGGILLFTRTHTHTHRKHAGGKFFFFVIKNQIGMEEGMAWVGKKREGFRVGLCQHPHKLAKKKVVPLWNKPLSLLLLPLVCLYHKKDNVFPLWIAILIASVLSTQSIPIIKKKVNKRHLRPFFFFSQSKWQFFLFHSCLIRMSIAATHFAKQRKKILGGKMWERKSLWYTHTHTHSFKKKNPKRKKKFFWGDESI